MLLRHKVFLFICVASILVCCSPIVFKPTIEDASFAKKKWEDSSIEGLNSGFKLYTAKCSGCHYLPIPKDYSEKKWLETMPEMGEKSHLSHEEYDLILKYVITKSYIQLQKK